MAAKKKPTKKSAKKPIARRPVRPGPTERRLAVLEDKCTTLVVGLNTILSTLDGIKQGAQSAGSQVTSELNMVRGQLTTVSSTLAIVSGKVSTMQADNEAVKQRLGGLFKV